MTMPPMPETAAPAKPANNAAAPQQPKRSAGRVSFTSRPQPVTDSAQGLDDITRGAELLAQTLDVRVHGTGGDLRIDAPHVRQKRVARLHSARPLEKRLQQPKLESGEGDRAAADAHLMAFHIERN